MTKFITSLLIAIFCVSISAYENTDSLWEVGFATASFYLPDYPASDEYRGRFVPVPYFIYRGKYLRSDDEGSLRGRFLNNENLEFDFSFGAGFPVVSKTNKARQGMKDMDWLGEIGPRLKVKFWSNKQNRKFELRLPIRYAFTTDFTKIESRGYVFAPYAYWELGNLIKDTTVTASIGATWATEALMDLFYQVDPEYVTTDRSEFDAKGGFLGASVGSSIYYRINNDMWVFGALSLKSYSGVANEKSPLYKASSSYTILGGFVWAIYRSEQKENSSI